MMRLLAETTCLVVGSLGLTTAAFFGWGLLGHLWTGQTYGDQFRQTVVIFIVAALATVAGWGFYAALEWSKRRRRD